MDCFAEIILNNYAAGTANSSVKQVFCPAWAVTKVSPQQIIAERFSVQ